MLGSCLAVSASYLRMATACASVSKGFTDSNLAAVGLSTQTQWLRP